MIFFNCKKRFYGHSVHSHLFEKYWPSDFSSCSSGCQSDHLGFSYSGNMSVSASGRLCLRWNDVLKIVTNNYKYYHNKLDVLHFTRLNLTTNQVVNADQRLMDSSEESFGIAESYHYLGLLHNFTNIMRTRFSGIKIFGDFLPPNLHGAGNQCRNSRLWPFHVADPICVVAHPESGRPVFDLCAVPLCASSRKS